MKINNFENNFYIHSPQVAEPQVDKTKSSKQNPQQPPRAKVQEDTPEVRIDSTVNIPAGSHLVQPKETLYSIANHYGTSVAEIIALNPDLKTDKNGNKIIIEGSILKVSNIEESPEITTSETPENVYGSWTIEPGKGSYSVMSKFNLYKEELAKLNPEIDLDNIQKGTVFKVPGYQVKAGDNLSSIAKQHDITLEMLKDLNPNIKELIKVGDIINVPKQAGQDLNLGDIEVEFDVIEEETPKILTHQVQNGEALSKIAEKYNVPMWAIMLKNNIENEDKILRNQVLEIPTAEEVAQLEKLKNTQAETPKKDEKPKTHTVKKGDTLSEIALKYGISVKNLKEWNNLSGDQIKVGKTLLLNEPATKEKEAIKYKIKSGDVLSKIALQYGVSTASIMYKNNIQNPKHIQPGQVIVIPDKTEVAKLEKAQEEIEIKQTTQPKQTKKISSKKSTHIPAGKINASRGIVIHKVQKNETLQDISKKYDIPVKDLQMYNENLRGIKSTTSLSEKEIKNIQIIATKKAVIDSTGVSEEFINDLIAIEKKRNTMYNDDCGIPTIGIGHNTKAYGDTNFYKGKTLSDNQIYSLLARDIKDAQKKIINSIGKDAFDKMSRGQKEALYGLIFNTGGLSGSPKLAEALKNSDYVEAACQMDHACGTINGRKQVLPGLAKRRFMDISKFIEGSRFSRSELKTIMHSLQELYDNGFKNIKKQNTKVDYNAYAKKFLGEYIDKGWIVIRE